MQYIKILQQCHDALHSLFIHEIKISEKGSFCELKPQKLKIEFIGDSITSGEGLAGSANDWDWIPQWFVGSNTYAAQLSRMLNVDFSVISEVDGVYVGPGMETEIIEFLLFMNKFVG